MSRPHKIRRVTTIPSVSGFKPYGDNITKNNSEVVFLLCEEYEALRLNDYENCNQCEAASIMQISRPTFTRIYLSARRKIALAFVEGRQIIIEGGKVEFTKGWFKCNDCSSSFNKLEEDELICPICKSKNLNEYIQDNINIGENIENKDLCGRNICGNRRNNKI